MNMNEAPTIEQLKQLYAGKNDLAGRHTLWVSNDGEVHLDLIPSDLSPANFIQSQVNIRFRCETYDQGNGYVGPEAANDNSFMQQVLDLLIRHWNAGTTGYVDY